jgi:hypothetical protein
MMKANGKIVLVTRARSPLLSSRGFAANFDGTVTFQLGSG